MKNTKAVLEDLHGMVAQYLLSHLHEKEVDPRVVTAAIRFLKDNGIDAMARPGDTIEGILEALRTAEAEEVVTLSDLWVAP